MMKKLSNRVIDLEKEAYESYKPYYKKREDNNQPKPPPHSPASMNLTEVGMDNFAPFIGNLILKKIALNGSIQ